MCIMSLAAPQGRRFPWECVSQRRCLLGEGRWITKPYGEYSRISKMSICCPLSFGTHILPFSRILPHPFPPVSAGWLDDIGLPQYKDQFHESRVDGRMLQYLTVVRVFPFNSSLVPVSTQLRCPWGGYFKLDSTTSLTLYSLKIVLFVT